MKPFRTSIRPSDSTLNPSGSLSITGVFSYDKLGQFDKSAADYSKAMELKRKHVTDYYKLKVIPTSKQTNMTRPW